MSRTLVTGGAGFIGSHLVDRLIGEGKSVTVLDDFSVGSRAHLIEADRSARLRIVEGSVLSGEDTKAAMEGCDVVFHLAVKSVRHALGRPLENQAVNAGGTLNVLEAARRSGVRRFVYCSSSEVYGNPLDTLMCEDTTVCKPSTVYGGSKLAGEHYTAAYRETYGLPAAIVRPFNTYGPRSHLHGESGEVIPRFFARILTGERPVIFGDGHQTRDLVFVTDTVRAIARAAEVDDAVGRVVNIASGKAVTVLELAQKISAICLGAEVKPEFHPPRPGDVRALCADVEHCRNILEFQPQIDLDQGLRLYLTWLENSVMDNPLSLARVPVQNWVTA